MTFTTLPPADACRLADFLAGGATLDLTSLESDLARELAGPLLSANGSGRVSALEACIADRDDAEAIRRALLAQDPSVAPLTAQPLPVSDCPDLPAEAKVEHCQAKSAGTWLDEYVDYVSALAPMTPRYFHESAALWLGSTAIARRLQVPMPFGQVYPNLFICWIAQTTLYSKTTALEVPVEIAHGVFPHLLAPQEMSVESFLSDLAGCEPTGLDKHPDLARKEWEAERDFAAQRGLVLDEMSGLLSSAGRDYNAGLMEAFLRFFDCANRYARSTRSQGRVVVRHAYLTFLGASTPLGMSAHLTAERTWAMGWWPRAAILTPEQPPDYQAAREMTEPPIIRSTLRALLVRLPASQWPEPPPALAVLLGDGVYGAWERYSKATRYDLLRDGRVHERLHGTYGRLATQALKVATVLAAFDWVPRTDQVAPRIELPHLARAVGIVERWRASAHRALAGATGSAFDKRSLRVLRQIDLSDDPSGPTFRDLTRALRDLEPDEIMSTLRQLMLADEVEQTDPISRGGRPAVHYRRPKG